MLEYTNSGRLLAMLLQIVGHTIFFSSLFYLMRYIKIEKKKFLKSYKIKFKRVLLYFLITAGKTGFFQL